jgi:hypothetical protein
VAQFHRTKVLIKWNNGMMEDWNVEDPVFSGVEIQM